MQDLNAGPQVNSVVLLPVSHHYSLSFILVAALALILIFSLFRSIVLALFNTIFQQAQRDMVMVYCQPPDKYCYWH
jgi:hypothetical protein